MPKLTKTAVDAAPVPAEGDAWLWDSELPGFGIRVQSSGRKTYVARYRTHAGIQRKQTVGRCTDIIPDKARELARKIFAAVAEGRDPSTEKTALKSAPTVADLEQRYMKEHARPFKKAGSVERDEALWRLHVLTALGKKRVDSVTQADVLSLMGSLSEHPATANACVALLSKAFNLADLWKWRTDGNPCRHIKKYRIRERETILSPQEIQRLDATMTEMVEERAIQKSMADLIRLLLITGCRLNEIMSSKQAWIDRDRSLLLLPDSKVGQRRIPLSEAAMEIINGIEEGEWLIPGRIAGEHLMHPQGIWKRIKARAKLPAEMRLHDLRHTAGSLAHMAGLTQKQVATMLGHRQLSTTERYLHGLATDQARAINTVGAAMTQSWARPAHPVIQ